MKKECDEAVRESMAQRSKSQDWQREQTQQLLVLQEQLSQVTCLHYLTLKHWFVQEHSVNRSGYLEYTLPCVGGKIAL